MGSYANGIFEYSLLFASCGAFLLLFSLFINYMSGQGRAAFIGKTILFVTAHPDDECMFFAPCIQQLSRLCDVHLLCLSSGDYYGQGDDRKKELRESCGTLGIWPTNVSVIDHSALPDDPAVKWDSTIAGRFILSHIINKGVNIVITFDQYGVSGHANHIAIFNALQKLMREGQLATLNRSVPVYVLQSVNLLRKYISILDLLFSVFSRNIFVSSLQDFYTAWKAMTAHQSQLVWFRKLYIVFSRYMLINTLHMLDKTKLASTY